MINDWLKQCVYIEFQTEIGKRGFHYILEGHDPIGIYLRRIVEREISEEYNQKNEQLELLDPQQEVLGDLFLMAWSQMESMRPDEGWRREFSPEKLSLSTTYDDMPF